MSGKKIFQIVAWEEDVDFVKNIQDEYRSEGKNAALFFRDFVKVYKQAKGFREE